MEEHIVVRYRSPSAAPKSGRDQIVTGAKRAATSPIAGGNAVETLAKFRQTLRHYLAFAERAAAVEGVTPQQFQVLLAIKGRTDSDRMSVGMLAEAMLIAPHTALELAQRLRDAGLLSIVPDPSDGRRRLLALTPAARDILGRLTTAHLAELQERGGLLLSLLSKIIAASPHLEPGKSQRRPPRSRRP